MTINKTALNFSHLLWSCVTVQKNSRLSSNLQSWQKIKATFLQVKTFIGYGHDQKM